MSVKTIARELRVHVPFTAMGTVSGIAIILILFLTHASRTVSEAMFWSLHPLHVLLSAQVTTAMYRLHTSRRPVRALLIGYSGSVGIATLSDSLIPFVGEWLLGLPNRGLHLGFIEKWWIVNSLAFLGIALGWVWPRTRFPHAGHVLLSTWASLFHMTMAVEGQLTWSAVGVVAVFLFLAVWIPCCTSDIVFPLLWVDEGRRDDER